MNTYPPWHYAPQQLLSLVALCTVLLSGCAAAVDQVFPTAAPSPTPTVTPPPTLAVTITPTPFVLAANALGTLGAEIDPALIAASPTPLISVFATPYLPSPTVPPVALGAVRIEYFSADVQQAAPGDTVTVFWAAGGAETAIIYRVNAETGKPIRQWNVGARGSLQIKTREDEPGDLQLQLVIGTDDNQAQESITIAFSCTGGWFITPAPAGCPNAPIFGSILAYQRFERGRMVWIAQQKRVYILYEDGKEPGWEAYPDEFTDGMPESDPSISPPDGLGQPVRGFGLVWRANPTVRDRLGFSTEPETSYNSDYQGDPVAADGQMAFRLADGAVVVLNGADRTWRTTS